MQPPSGGQGRVSACFVSLVSRTHTVGVCYLRCVDIQGLIECMYGQPVCMYVRMYVCTPASCYPAAFAPLPDSRASLTVVILEAEDTTNALTFGIAKRDMRKSGSDGMVRRLRGGCRT
jgi:hypothetical protein